LRVGGLPLAVMQCSSVYPTTPEQVGLNVIPFFRERYGCAVGLSDHSAKIYAGLAAATLGIEVLEVHLTLSREMFGPDVVASVTTDELRQLVEGIRWIEAARHAPIDKHHVPSEIAALRGIFMKSVVARRELPAGAELSADDLAARKPGSGIPAARLGELVGRRLRVRVAAGQLMAWSDLEGE
jgi:N-acetylneuraminate synthase